MSKRKGRRGPLTSEIKSVLRPPADGGTELDAASSVTEGDDDTEQALEDELAAFGSESAATGGSAEPAPGAEPARAAEDSDGETSPTESAEVQRPRRLRAVRARSTRVKGAAGSDPLAPSPEAMSPEDRRDPDAEARDRWGDDGGPALDFDDEPHEPIGAGDESEDGADEEPFIPQFPREAIEGDDTEGFLRGLLEALLFTSQKPLDLKDLARSAGIDKPRARELLEQLMQTYEGRGLCIEEVAGGFVMRSSARYAPYIQKILALRPVRLSRAQLETLAIVAYRQPVTKPEVDDIRGVDSGQVIKGLLERSLLKMLGKKDEPGRPTLYGTTNDFLELLNLQSLKDLPTLREYTELSEESQRKFLDETGEAAPSLTFERPPSAPSDESDEAVSPVDEDESAARAEAVERGAVEGEMDPETESSKAVADSDPLDDAQPESSEVESAIEEATGEARTDEEDDASADEESDDDEDESDDDDEIDDESDDDDDGSDDDDDGSDDDDDESDDDDDEAGQPKITDDDEPVEDDDEPVEDDDATAVRVASEADDDEAGRPKIADDDESDEPVDDAATAARAAPESEDEAEDEAGGPKTDESDDDESDDDDDESDDDESDDDDDDDDESDDDDDDDDESDDDDDDDESDDDDTTTARVALEADDEAEDEAGEPRTVDDDEPPDDEKN